jgi:murein DD-endopeptidase MepM/ murein hydrolase activator NlpD
VQAVSSVQWTWSGRSLARLLEVHSRIQARKAPHWSDWWIWGVPPLAVAHLAVYLVLQSRPGRIGPEFWRWGPPGLAVAAGALLLAALWSAVWNRRTWSVPRLAGYLGLIALVVAIARYQEYPSSHDGAPSRVRFRLPLDGPVTVAWGGASARDNYHAGTPAERWAYDLLVTRDGSSHKGGGSALTDYYAYGLPVRAPADGRVVVGRDGEPDVGPGRTRRGQGAGNHVVIEVAPGQYLFIAHLRPGSLVVSAGQRVTAGDIVGIVGNSGHTTEPHVHLHLQDTPVAGSGEGIPFDFVDYVMLATGKQTDRGMPTGGTHQGRFAGEIVRSAS